MKFKFLKNNLFKILIILIIVLIIFYIIKKYKEKDLVGYSNLDDPYIMPKIYKNLITDDENKYIIKEAEKRFEKSEVYGDDDGDGNNIGKIDLKSRKSETAWLSYYKDKKINKIMSRICKKFNYKLENCEYLQVVKYEPGGFFTTHVDPCCENTQVCKKENSLIGKRLATILIYLNDDYEGGETEFVLLNKKIKPEKNSAVLFMNVGENDNKCHLLSYHRGNNIISGTKYICNIWIREKKYYDYQ